MAPDERPDDQTIAEEDRRESHSDWTGLATLVATLCVGFVLLVVLGYAVRGLIRSFG